MKTLRSAAVGGLLSLAVLAGCSKSEPEQPPMVENATVEDVTPGPTDSPEAVEPPAPAPAPANVAVAPPPAEKIAPDAQMIDDADATGMTARATRDAQDGDAAPVATNDQAAQ